MKLSICVYTSWCVLMCDLCNSQVRNIDICFPEKGIQKHHYPAADELTEEIYSVSNYQRISRPIVAVLCTIDGKPITTSHSFYAHKPKYFSISSNPAEESNGDCVNSSAGVAIKFCLYAANEYEITDPRRYDKKYFKRICSKEDETSGKLTLHHIPIQDIYLIAQGIYHELTSPSNMPLCFLRKIQFSLYTNGKFKTTNLFKVYTRVPHLKWIDKPKDETVANTPFNISLIIVNENDEQVTDGLDSSLIVEITVSFQAKIFMRDTLVEDFLYKTDVELSGDEVITSMRNYDQVLHKQAVGGKVEFKNVVILDVYEHHFLFLNATLLVPRTGDRQPLDYSDLTPICVILHEIATQFSYSQFCDCKEGAFREKTELRLYNLTFNCDARHTTKSMLLFPFKVVAQKVATLKIINAKQDDKKFSENVQPANRVIKVTTHVRIPDLWVVVMDENNRRIFSGPDSDLNIRVIVDPPNTAISDYGAKFKTHRGLGTYMGAVFQIADDVKFQFQVDGRENLTSNFSQSFNITGEVNLAIFGRFNTAGLNDDPEPVTESFAQLAVDDINNGYPFDKQLKYLRKLNLKFNLKIYDHEQSFPKTVEQFSDMLEEQEQANGEKVIGIIGFGDNKISRSMHALLATHKLPLVAYRENLKIFVRDKAFKTMFCIGWNNADLTVFLGHTIQTHWQYIIVIEDSDARLPYDFQMGISSVFQYVVAYRIIIGTQTSLETDITNAKATGSKYVIHFVYAPKQYFMFREAIKHKFAQMHGYQWYATNVFAKQFDWENNSEFCAKEPTCTVAFSGMQFLQLGYNISGYSTDLWYHVNRKFHEGNPADTRGIPTFYNYNDAEQFALGYDSALVFAYAIEKQLKNDMVITIDSTLESMNKVSFEGLTGTVKFSKGGNWRVGSQAILVTVTSNISTKHDLGYLRNNRIRWMFVSELYVRHQMDIFMRKKKRSYTRSLEFGNLGTFRHIIEIPTETFSTLYKKYKMAYTPPTITNDTILISRFYPSTCGYLSRKLWFISKKGISNAKQICLRTDLQIPAFICNASCGGGRLYTDSAVEYKFGTCVGPDECSCRTVMQNGVEVVGYTGQYCEKIICTCYQGNCTAPYKCKCNPGWHGSECINATCINECVNGKCIKPNQCKCHVGYSGENCTILLGALVAGILFCILVVGIFLFFLIWFIKKRHTLREQLRNLDWLVDWKEVSEKGGARSVYSSSSPSTQAGVSAATSTKVSAKGSIKDALVGSAFDSVATQTSAVMKNVVEWKSNDYFAKKFDRSSLDKTSMTLRTEIKNIRVLKHPNLVRFFGACLTAPNVAILLEIVPKGSLYDILQLHLYNLSWAFKFSILRDIALGMEFLHKSDIGSHGNLKSKNCLIDNRWTCKVSGFGVPTLRKKVYQVERLKEIYYSMLWTAPELLQTCMTPNDVGAGTKLGDIYSFGIVLTELCTHEPPFFIEQEILSVEELIRILKNFHDPAARGIKKLLESHNYDTNKPIRPALTNALLPEIYSEKKGILDLVSTTTSETPIMRTTFKDIVATIQKIHPLKGQLVENLIFMLEKYANHLEEMFSDKVTEVNSEKLKTEELISRLLPPSIAQQMKMNQEVLPEHFDNVTFLYSDIVGFTTVAKESKPMEVVELLNDLYTRFDNIIESFDTYKIETIGDAYFVTSGVPIPVPTHYEQIATMALYFLAAVDSLPIRHLPTQKLKVRIGIHSGSCVAGVVGIKMPRYCIFGEDVTIAQFMESHGLANRIQMSENTAKLLDKVGIYYIVYRAEMTLKSLGVFHTYWLIGKQGIDIILPSISGGESATALSFASEQSQRSGAATGLSASTPTGQLEMPVNVAEYAEQIRKSITEEMRKSFLEKRSVNESQISARNESTRSEDSAVTIEEDLESEVINESDESDIEEISLQ